MLQDLIDFALPISHFLPHILEMRFDSVELGAFDLLEGVDFDLLILF